MPALRIRNRDSAASGCSVSVVVYDTGAAKRGNVAHTKKGREKPEAHRPALERKAERQPPLMNLDATIADTLPTAETRGGCSLQRLVRPFFQDNAVTIINGDCREVLPTLERAALILTDPPYGVNLEYDTYSDTEANWYELMGKMLPLMRAQAEMVICVSCQIKRLAWVYQNHAPDWLIAWHKGSPGHVSYIGFNDWDPLLVYGKPKGLAMHDYMSVPNTERMGGNGHPCPKPEKWATWLIERATKPGDLVIDPFMGSGTTLRAAKDLNRRAIGIDLSPKYCEIAKRRMSQGVFDWA